LRLGNATVFTSGGIGPKGARSPFANAFRLLLAEPLADQVFLELIASRGVVQQLYGLAGIRSVAPGRFASVESSFRGRIDTVPVLDGCNGGERRVAEVVGTGRSGGLRPLEIANGTWSEEFARVW